MTVAGGRLELVHITKRYGATTVLRGVSLTVEDGEFMTILGPSGSGKTTILRLIGGFTEPAEGQIRFDGVDVSAVPIFRRPFNTVFQDYALFPHMTVGQNVGYGLLVRGVARREIRSRVADALGVVALDGFAERYPSQLSGGQRQRVALARALDLRAQADPARRAARRARCRAAPPDAGLSEVPAAAGTDHLPVRHPRSGGGDRDVRSDLRDEPAARSSRSGRQTKSTTGRRATSSRPSSATTTCCRAPCARDAAVDTPLGALRCTDPGLAALAAGAPVTIAVRPEALRIELSASGSRPGTENRLPVAVRSVDFVGPTSRIQVAHHGAPDRPLLVKVPSRMGGLPIRAGDQVDLVWAAADCVAIADRAS